MKLPKAMKVRFNLLQIIGFVLLITALVVVTASRSVPDKFTEDKNKVAHHNDKNVARPSQGKQDSNPKDEGHEESKNRKLRSSKNTQGDSPDSFPEIEQLLSNDNVSNEESARQLAQIALDGSRRDAERLEAMEHGKNLGFGQMLTLSSNPNLPIPLAESYLHGLHGHDQTKEQVSGALGLLNHVDPDISQQAGILLGFLIGAEVDNESPDRLREKADAFLKQPVEGSEEVSGQ